MNIGKCNVQRRDLFEGDATQRVEGEGGLVSASGETRAVEMGSSLGRVLNSCDEAWSARVPENGVDPLPVKLTSACGVVEVLDREFVVPAFYKDLVIEKVRPGGRLIFEEGARIERLVFEGEGDGSGDFYESLADLETGIVRCEGLKKLDLRRFALVNKESGVKLSLPGALEYFEIGEMCDEQLPCFDEVKRGLMLVVGKYYGEFPEEMKNDYLIKRETWGDSRAFVIPKCVTRLVVWDARHPDMRSGSFEELVIACLKHKVYVPDSIKRIAITETIECIFTGYSFMGVSIVSTQAAEIENIECPPGWKVWPLERKVRVYPPEESLDLAGREQAILLGENSAIKWWDGIDSEVENKYLAGV